MKKILMIATGGTIASKRTEGGLAPLILSEELLAYVPAAKAFCEVEALQLLNLDSSSIEPRHWLMIAAAIRENYRRYDGFVVCHGTDTMAFTAAGLSYLVQNSEKPIVLTGAQKPIDMEDTDARVNLMDSLRFACWDGASGVSVVFGGHVIAGTRARKMRAKSYDAFESINFPCLADIRDGQIIPYITNVEIGGGPAFYDRLNSDILLIKLFPGLSPALLAHVAGHYDAFILEGFGVGNLSDYEGQSFVDAVEQLASRGKIVVMATQVTHEGSDIRLYEVVSRLARDYPALMECRDMTTEAAVAKLMWILGQTTDPSEVRRLFTATIHHDVLLH